MSINEEFQREFIPVMEGLIRSAINETAKLVESKVQEMKDEMERLRRQNDVLREAGDRRNARYQGGSNNRTRRDVCIQCNGLSPPSARSGTPTLERGDTAATSTSLLQVGNQQFALVVVKKEESDTYEITPTYYVANLTEDQSKQFVVQNAEGSFVSTGTTLIPVQLAVYPEQSEKPTAAEDDSGCVPPDHVFIPKAEPAEFIPKAEPAEFEIDQQGMQF